MKVPEALLPHLSCPTEDHQGWCSAHSCRRFPHRGQSKDTCSVFVQNSNTWVSAQFTSLCISVSNSLFRNHTWAGHAFDWFYWPCSRGQGGALGDPEPPWKPLCHAVLIMVPHDTLAQFYLSNKEFCQNCFCSECLQDARVSQCCLKRARWHRGPLNPWPFHHFLFRAGNGFNLLSTVSL